MELSVSTDADKWTVINVFKISKRRDYIWETDQNRVPKGDHIKVEDFSLRALPWIAHRSHQAWGTADGASD